MTSPYSVILSKLAESKFDKLIRSDRKLGEQVAKAVDRVASDPELGELLRGEWKGHRKYRTGRYRIIYRIEREKSILYIVTIDDRKDVYR
jgi:mRNA-degrading endonuclease RelE of RelBE toxin-antitoxin system